MSTDPLADRLLEIVWDAASPGTPRTAEVLARAAREHIAAEIEALADRLDAYDDNDGVGDPDAYTLRIAASIARGQK